MNTKSGRKSKKWWIIFISSLLIVVLIKPTYTFYNTIKKYYQLSSNLPDLPIYNRKHPSKSFFSEKKWLHRVNSIERAILMSGKYKGLELDVVFDSQRNYFDVGHPPTPSINLSLEKIISSIPHVQDHYFWLDFKNLKDSNKIASCELLHLIASKYNLINNIIVESDQPELLTWFTLHGFYTSYYIPVFDLDVISKEEIIKKYNIIMSHLSKSQVNALSAQSRSLPFLERYFPDYDILLWHLDENKGLNYYFSISYLFLKQNVKVFLVNEESRNYR